MPLFVINCFDKPGSLDLRLATRPTHVAYLNSTSALKLAGPYLDESGDPNGSMLVIEVADLAAAKAFAAADPYALAGLFASTDVRAFTHTLGQLP